MFCGSCLIDLLKQPRDAAANAVCPESCGPIKLSPIPLLSLQEHIRKLAVRADNFLMPGLEDELARERAQIPTYFSVAGDQ
jgi:hypothetical protein